MEGLSRLTRSVSLSRKLIGKLLLETAAEKIGIESAHQNHPLEIISRRPKHPSSDKPAVAIVPIIHIEPVSRGSFTSRQCLCRGPRGRSAVIKQHAVCLYTMQMTLLPTNRAQCVVDLW